MSPSSRRAWIEIRLVQHGVMGLLVALLAEGVDRNPIMSNREEFSSVALLAEGVDRN